MRYAKGEETQINRYVEIGKLNVDGYTPHLLMEGSRAREGQKTKARSNGKSFQGEWI